MMRLRKNRSSRDGVILVMVLLLITLCGAMTSQIASRVIRLSGQANNAQEEAQDRWATVSLRRACLEVAPKILASNSSGSGARQGTSRTFWVVLGRTRHEVIVQDESAKLPVHRLLKAAPLEQVKPIIRQLAGGASNLRSVFSRQPTQWSEVFHSAHGKSSGTGAASTNEPEDSLRFWFDQTKQLTLWSDGLLNLRTCEASTLDALWRFQFSTSAPNALHDLRNSSALAGSVRIDDYLKENGATEAEMKFAKDWLCQNTSTYSLWLMSRRTEGRSFTAIYVSRKQSGFAEENSGVHYP